MVGEQFLRNVINCHGVVGVVEFDPKKPSANEESEIALEEAEA